MDPIDKLRVSVVSLFPDAGIRKEGGAAACSPQYKRHSFRSAFCIAPRSGSNYFAFLASLAAFLAVSTRVSKALGSAMAISDRALRFISMPACFRPYMNQL